MASLAGTAETRRHKSNLIAAYALGLSFFALFGRLCDVRTDGNNGVDGPWRGKALENIQQGLLFVVVR